MQAQLFHETHFCDQRPDWASVLKDSFGTQPDHCFVAHATQATQVPPMRPLNLAAVLAIYDPQTGRVRTELADRPAPTVAGEAAPTEGAALYLLATASLQPDDTTQKLADAARQLDDRRQQRAKRKLLLDKVARASPKRKLAFQRACEGLVNDVFLRLEQGDEKLRERSPQTWARYKRARAGAASPLTAGMLSRSKHNKNAPLLQELAHLQPEPPAATAVERA